MGHNAALETVRVSSEKYGLVMSETIMPRIRLRPDCSARAARLGT
ncbi:MAG: hypothetical protein R2856_10870 [Caldilineaceae bacterium]